MLASIVVQLVVCQELDFPPSLIVDSLILKKGSMLPAISCSWDSWLSPQKYANFCSNSYTICSFFWKLNVLSLSFSRPLSEICNNLLTTLRNWNFLAHSLLQISFCWLSTSPCFFVRKFLQSTPSQADTKPFTNQLRKLRMRATSKHFDVGHPFL